MEFKGGFKDGDSELANYLDLFVRGESYINSCCSWTDLLPDVDLPLPPVVEEESHKHGGEAEQGQGHTGPHLQGGLEGGGAHMQLSQILHEKS